MSVNVIMPKLGESITEGTILEWKKQVGDSIEKDETLLEISTDKVDSEVPSPAKGKISEILYKVNDVVSVGEVIARIGGNLDEVQNPSNDKKQEKSSPNKKSEKEDVNLLVKPLNDIQDMMDDIESKKINLNKYNDTKSNDNKITKRFYSPLVKSIASKEGISLSELDSLPGSGANNRVNKNDILNYIKNKKDSGAEVHSIHLENKIEPMGHVRKMIADHMIKSRETSVHVYSTSEIDVTNIVDYRNSNKESFNSRYQTSLTYTPFFIDSVVKAIHDFPLINASVQGDNIQHNQNINIGVAVALNDNNLIVPVIQRTEELNFLGIARASSDLAIRARENKLLPDEVKGSTFTVTNPGIFGSLFGMGIINQPNVSLLSVGTIHKRPVVKETEYGDVIVVRSMVYLTLAYDHRLIDGSYGTRFLSRIKELLENFSNDDIKI